MNYIKKSPNATENAAILPQLLLKNRKTSLITMTLHYTWHLLNWFKKKRDKYKNISTDKNSMTVPGKNFILEAKNFASSSFKNIVT